MIKIAGIDSQILIYSVQRNPSPENVGRTERSAKLLESLRGRGTRVILPSVSLGEFLVGVEDRDIEDVLRTMSRDFQIAPYDAPAAIHAARIRRTIRKDDIHGELPDFRRCEITPDCQILGIAIARKVEVFYTNDKGLLKIGKPFLNVSPLPEFNTQLEIDLEDSL